MPDILIRDVALPKYGCAGCYFKTGKYCGIITKNESVEEYSLRAERHPDCPLVELPEHGDLIDLSELQKFPIRLDHYDKEHGDEHFVYGIESLMEYAECLPVVVQAERSEP